MNRRTPSLKTQFERAILKLVACVCLCGLALQSGCAVLSIPSYRADSFGSPEHAMAGSAASTSSIDECDDVNYVPAFPTVPTPGFIKRWKEHRNLPEGPEGLKFHPLPTRPMFQPKPGSAPLNQDWACDDPLSMSAEQPLGTNQFGIVPLRSQWSNVTQPESNLLDSNSVDSAKKPNAPASSLAEPTPVEEIPRPK